MDPLKAVTQMRLKQQQFTNEPQHLIRDAPKKITFRAYMHLTSLYTNLPACFTQITATNISKNYINVSRTQFLAASVAEL